MAEGKVPDTFFYQVDGGSENANLLTLGMCELIVALGITKRIVLTRLLVGHTHCDIDAIFGVIWKRVRDGTILTPQQWADAIQEALSASRVPVEIEDVFVLPDFKDFLGPYLLDISNCFKMENTQLQWIFEYIGFCPSCGVDIQPLCRSCAKFPSGVKVTYRAYSSDKAYEFHKTNDDELNVVSELTNVIVQPVAQPEHDIPEGMYILKSLPGNRLTANYQY